MSERNSRIWSHYQPDPIVCDYGAFRSLTGIDAGGQRVCVHEVPFSDSIPAAIRMRLHYEVARLSSVVLDRVATPCDFEFDDHVGRVVCPLLSLPTLAERLARGPLSVEETLSIADDVFEALEGLHAHGLIRRCLLPADIYIDHSNGRTRALLAGYSPMAILQGLTNEDGVSTFATYASPEALGALEEDVKASADLYSAGIVLFACLTGHAPFSAEQSSDLLFRHMTSPVPDLTEINPAIPRSLNDIVQHLLLKHPRDRYQSAAGARYDIQQVREILRGSGPVSFVAGTMDRRETLIEPAYVGRTEDVALLESELRAVADGVSSAVLITAPSGVGKSRLMLEISRTAVAHGFRILRAQGHDHIGLAPLASLRQALLQCVEIVRSDAALRQRLRLELSEFARELAAVLPSLVETLELPVPEHDVEDLSDRGIAVTLATFLGSLGSEDAPVLLLLDDAQWADDLTLTMLERWNLTQPRHTMLVVATRPFDRLADRLHGSLNCRAELTLGPLNRDESNKLAESMAGDLPAEVLDAVWKISTGNPFAASAVLRGLVEGHILTPSNTGWQFDQERLLDLQMSGEAAEVLKQRMVRLPEESRKLLAVGAVLGKTFSIEMASQLADIPRERVVELLLEPRRNHLIWESVTGCSCSFVHDQIRGAVMRTLTAAACQSIHQRAAEYLQQHEPDRIFDIASHYDAAGRADLALPFALQAARSAQRHHALEAAEQQYSIVLRSARVSGEEPDASALHGLGDVLMLTGRYDEAEPLLEAAIRRADSPVTRALVTLKLGELAFKQDAKDRAVQLWESALKSLGGRLPTKWCLPFCFLREFFVQALHTLLPRQFTSRVEGEAPLRDRLIWRLHSRLAYGYWYLRGKLSVLYVHLRGMNLAERYRPTAELAQAYSEHAPAMSLIPLNRRGIAYGRRSLQIRTEQDDIWGQGQSLHFLAIALYSASQFEECVDVGRRSVRILERAGDFWEKHIAQYQVAASLYRLGRLSEAVQLAREAYESGLAVGDDQVCGNIIEVWARAANGDLPAEVVQRELARSRTDVQGITHVLLAQAVQMMGDEHPGEAAAVLDHAIRTARQAGIDNTYTSPLYAWKATALRCQLEMESPLTRQRRQQIIKAHHRAARCAVRVSLRFRNERPHALRELAWACVFRNRNLRAVHLLENSLRVATSHSAAYEILQTEILLHQIRSEIGFEDAAGKLDQARNRLTAFRDEQLPRRMVTSLSLVDRFDSLLESGREIASTISPELIFDKMVTASRRLLRSDCSRVIPIDETGQPVPASVPARQWILNAIKSRQAVAADAAGTDFRSLLACPVLVRGEVVACLVVSNSEVRDLFGQNELRIANYVTTIAGAAMENAEGFRELKELNINLESIVSERTSAVEARSRELQQTADHLRSTQAQLAAARDAAETASQAKTDFLAHMSHEIRTPIGAVLGFTELLLQSDEPLSAQQRQHLQRVHSNGSHLHGLLNDLLDLSRIEAGELTIESLKCPPYRLLHDVLAALQSRAIHKGLRLSLRVTGRVPESIVTDPTRLRQIITNLVGNAIKFTEEGGVDLFVETSADERLLKILVQDSGVGIDPAAQQAVFEPFRQADDSVNRKFGGTGLGLSISRKLARALGGDIELTSEPGAGSTFTVSISTGDLDNVRLLTPGEAEATLHTERREARRTADLSGTRILIADDVEANRELFSHVLRSAGAECVLVDNGARAIDRARSRHFDLILMDMRMPEVDGYTATQQLRKDGITVPIVALTANGMDEDRRRCREVGCSGYLTKPISTSDLLAAVAKKLRRKTEAVADTAPAASTAENAGQRMPRRETKRHEQPARRKTNAAAGLPADPFFRDLALRFVVKVQQSLPSILEALDQSDTELLADKAHWMKGTGGSVGLPLLTEIGRELESAAIAGDLTAASVLTGEITSFLLSLQPELSEASVLA
ncbi:MAG: ATP-binding protein [Planctomycetaceae bacterium]